VGCEKALAAAMADAGENARQPAARRARDGSLATTRQQGRLFDAEGWYSASP
jgi:hypothetical protein